MEKLILDGIIFPWTALEVREQLKSFDGSDIQVEISSPGGLVFPGITIYNLLKNYSGKVHTHLMGLAASMASYIALAGEKITAESNAVFMIHNVRGFAEGDHNTMKKAAQTFEGLSNLLAKTYAERTGKPLAEIRRLMDEETFYFGDEAKKAGFVDEIKKAKIQKPKNEAINEARAIIESCIAELKEHETEKEDDLQKVAAYFDFDPESNYQNTEAVVTPYDDKSEIIDREWISSEADARIRKHTGSEDEPNNSGSADKQYKNYFSWHDPKAADTFGAYKLPIADVQGGKKVINIRAVRNALARLKQTKGIPAGDRNRIQSILRKYIDKFSEEEKGESMNKETLKKDHPELYNELISEGINQERDRVTAHLKLGKACNAMDFSIECIEKGESTMKESVSATYQSFALNKSDLTNRGADNPDSVNTPDNPDDPEKAQADLLAAVMKHSKVDGAPIHGDK